MTVEPSPPSRSHFDNMHTRTRSNALGLGRRLNIKITYSLSNAQAPTTYHNAARRKFLWHEFHEPVQIYLVFGQESPERRLGSW